jgi:hypothetical protein
MNLTGVRGESNAAMADELSMSKVPKGLKSKCMTDVRIAQPSGIREGYRILKANLKFNIRDVVGVICC